jgi:hypothetical protein
MYLILAVIDNPRSEICRPAFAEVITKYFTEKIPNSVFTTNPCRIKYCTKEIIIFREDILTKMGRNSLYYPTTGDIPDNVSLVCVCRLVDCSICQPSKSKSGQLHSF